LKIVQNIIEISNTGYRIAGIDPAYRKPCAIAIVDENEELLALENFNYELAGLEIADYKRRFKINRIACEANWLGTNVATLQKLSQVLGWIQGAAILSAIEFEKVAPTAWQNKIPCFRRVSRLMRDQVIISMARSMASIEQNITIDEASAIHIAFYSIRRYKSEKLKGVAQ